MAAAAAISAKTTGTPLPLPSAARRPPVFGGRGVNCGRCCVAPTLGIAVGVDVAVGVGVDAHGGAVAPAEGGVLVAVGAARVGVDGTGVGVG